ncbi:MAG TPA: hypothetical protein PKX16_05710 [Kiritimatiellia bacterium]|jgi:hypothetical protein|nr:hypothetical protein [Kiritimatiellia bacterium]HQQ60010.1 hypothetical protein [Kiritimatiellia bacterium]
MNLMREAVQAVCIWSMVLCGALSLWPFRFARRWKSWNLYLPVAGLLFYGLYEMALPAEVDVGIHMAVILSLQFLLWLNGMAKVAILAHLQAKSGGSRRRLRRQPQRLLQLVAAMVLAVACTGGFWFLWK